MAASANSRSSESKVRIRPASDEDVPALARLINAAFVVEQVVFDGNRVDDLGVRAYMSGGTFLVAEDSGGLAGCVYIETRSDRSYLEKLLPFYQRLGYEFVRTEPFPANLAAKVRSHYILMSKPLV